ncbi:MAG: uroporphyrinogen decarboxylase [Candidatus Omnitrophica bacterium]|nr:uroporphyrinogen decarboxylase [Candidatus Omnitrophota bacterium]
MPDFNHATVVCFENRKAERLAALVREHGGNPLSAPAMQEIRLQKNPELLSFGERLTAGTIDVVLFMSGGGAAHLLDTLSAIYGADALCAALTKTTVLARGPKSAEVLSAAGLSGLLVAPEPSTWREVLEVLDMSERGIELEGKCVAVQESGSSNAAFLAELQQRGARVVQVPIYRWALPDDTQPLKNAIHSLASGKIPFAVFTNSTQVRHVMRIAAELGLQPQLTEAFRKHTVVASIGPSTTDVLQELGWSADWESLVSRLEPLVIELARHAAELRRRKVDPEEAAALWVQERSQAKKESGPARNRSHFLLACWGEPTEVTPVWFMRQAGRYMEEYRRIRAKVPFLQMCRNADLVAEVTVSAAERIGADAAIVFSDILVVLEPMGLGLRYSRGEGPVIEGRIRGAEDIHRLGEINARESLQYVFDGVRRTREALADHLPLIGFCGAPFTLASYILEGGSSRQFLKTKHLMYTDSGAWHALMGILTRGLIHYLNGQIEAGADAVQIFDSWLGCLSPEDYRESVLPHTQALIQGVREGVPVIHFGTGTTSILEDMRRAGGQVIGVDWRVDLDAARIRVGYERSVQGNLDPAVLCTDYPTIRRHVRRILELNGGRPGHIFNLGHGVLPQTPVDHVIAAIDMVHEMSLRGGR